MGTWCSCCPLPSRGVHSAGVSCIQTCAVSPVIDSGACHHPEGAPILQHCSHFRSPSLRQAPARSVPSSGHSVWVEPAHAQAPVSGFLHSASCFRVHPCRRMIVLPFYSRITFHCVGGPAIYPFVGWSFGFFHSLALMRHTAAYGSRVDIRSHLGTFLAWNRRIL